jgi:quercetin dioxygenase-like cupin family protein
MGEPIDMAQAIATVWTDIDSEDVRRGVRRRGFGTDEVLLVMNEMEPDMDLAPHTHTFPQIALIVEGRALYHIGEAAYQTQPGSILLIPPGEVHYLEPQGEKVRNLDIFSPVREDLSHLLDWMRRKTETSG